MSEEHDSSDNVEFEESEVGPDNEKIGKKRGRRPSKKKKRPPVHPSFRAPGPPTAEGWGFILGFVAGSTVHWSIPDLAAMFNVAQTTLYEGLARQPGFLTRNLEQRGHGPEGDAVRRQAVATTTGNAEGCRGYLGRAPHHREPRPPRRRLGCQTPWTTAVDWGRCGWLGASTTGICTCVVEEEDGQQKEPYCASPLLR